MSARNNDCGSIPLDKVELTTLDEPIANNVIKKKNEFIFSNIIRNVIIFAKIHNSSIFFYFYNRTVGEVEN